jgi:hypothetical protein
MTRDIPATLGEKKHFILQLSREGYAYSRHEAKSLAPLSIEYRRLTSTTLIEYSKKDYNNEMYPQIQRKFRRELESPPCCLVDNNSHC